MNFSTVKYFLKEGFKNVWINRMMSLASILIMICCFILTGGAVLLSVNIKSTLKNIATQNSINVYLAKDITYEKAMMVEATIKKMPNVLACKYYSRDEAVEKYKEMLGELFEVLQGVENPLPDAFHITMKDLAEYGNTVNDIKAIDGVNSTSDRSDTAARLTSLDELITSVGLWFVTVLGVVSLFIISNTIKITLHNRRFEIYIMKCVGATNWFIRIPFLVEGAIIGVTAAVSSTFVLKSAYEQLTFTANKIIPFNAIMFEKMFKETMISFLIAGLIFGLIGSLISISRYLKKEGAGVAL